MTETDRIRSRAGVFTDTPAYLGEPLAVCDAGGRLFSWFVPIVDGDQLVGFVELLPDLNHRRTSHFERSGGGRPPASWWLDPDVVVGHARTVMREGERPGRPFLSFDGAPDRLAWAVPVEGSDSGRVIYVAGEVAWVGTSSGGIG